MFDLSCTSTLLTPLQSAQAHAQAGRFAEMLLLCQQTLAERVDDVVALLDVGTLLLNAGHLSRARACFDRVRLLAPDDIRAVVNLANLAREAGDPAQSSRLYAKLAAQQSQHPVIRRNALVSYEYDPDSPAPDRLQAARAWGSWAVQRAGGERSRPAMRPLDGRPLRVGYLSADLCQHTVGLFVQGVLQAHDPTCVTVFAYSAGQQHDAVTQAIKAASTFRDVSAINDAALAQLIRQDAVDVLVDLSGHTAGSRLTVFAHRPAPVQVAWLGYFATTGLTCMDAVLLDAWHAPPGTEAQFVEPLVRLPMGRFCYQPVAWAPAHVAPLPCLRNGHITFGCFNNTAKLNAGVLDVWAALLADVPAARLVLKWRTLVDDTLCRSLRQGFAARGIGPERIELRGISPHAELLNAYADIDIALDPFPFTGGLTSCEALWMGVPVVTWPQDRVVSRQTLAFLSAVGLPDLAANDAADYVRIAAALAADPARLTSLRSGLRARMQASPLMNLPVFTRALEDTLYRLYAKVADAESQSAMPLKTILHVGPGHRRNGAALPEVFLSGEWREIRLDIDPANEPDIVGSMLDMAAVADTSIDAIYSAHNIEHVFAHEVPAVLAEFLRVLKPQGFLVVTCPDLQSVCALVADDKLTDPAYMASAGPIMPLDILYGHGAALAAGHLYMAHKCGFTLKTLAAALTSASFKTIAGKRRLQSLELWMVASKEPMAEATVRELALTFLPPG